MINYDFDRVPISTIYGESGIPFSLGMSGNNKNLTLELMSFLLNCSDGGLIALARRKQMLEELLEDAVSAQQGRPGPCQRLYHREGTPFLPKDD